MCDCIEKVNGLLADRNTRLKEPIVFGNRPGPNLMIETEIIEKKRGARVTSMFASYCPFCGEKYGAPDV